MYNNPYVNAFYNPNYRPIEPQFAQPNANMQPAQQSGLQIPKSGLQGKLVDSVDSAKNSEYPFDGTISYFPLTDGSAIVTKQLGNDGTSKVVLFKPVSDKKDVVEYVTPKELEKALESIDMSQLDDITNEIEKIKEQLKELQTKSNTKR